MKEERYTRTVPQEILNREASFTALLEASNGICVSLFMPLERDPDKKDMNRIRLKNLIRQGEEMLAAQQKRFPDFTTDQTAALLEPMNEIVADEITDVHHSEGLAIFSSPSLQRVYYVPMPLEEQVLVNHHFVITPLLPLLNQGGRYYLLSLSQNKARLWAGTLFSLEPVAVPNLPGSMDEALAEEDPEDRPLQFHTATNANAPGWGDRAAGFHGQDLNREKKGAIMRYLRQVNAAVAAHLRGEKAPLLLASVDYLLPIYQEVNEYPHLLDEVIVGNPDDLTAHALHDQARPHIQSYLSQAQEAACQTYGNLSATDRTVQAIEAVVPAARYGQVGTLFIAEGEQAWGVFDEASGQVQMSAEAENGEAELVSFAAAQTLLQGGEVYLLPQAAMPVEAAIAAILRYAP